MTKNAEFIVKGWVTGESGRLTVIGRCGDEPIQVGDEFDALVRYKRPKYPDELGGSPSPIEEKPVKLRVEYIRAYEQQLSELGRGMTGSLVLDGEGKDDVAEGWVLGMRNGSPMSEEDIARP